MVINNFGNYDVVRKRTIQLSLTNFSGETPSYQTDKLPPISVTVVCDSSL